MQKSQLTPVPYLSEVTRLLGLFEKAYGKPVLPQKPDRKPRFNVLQFAPANPGNPWAESGTDGDSRFVQFEITRDMKNVEVIAEVTACDGFSCGHEKDHTTGDCIEIGDTFDLYGFQRILTLSEEDEARLTWVAVQQMRAAKEAE